MSFVLDTFTDVNGTDLASHTGEIGATWTKITGDSTGNAWITSNRAAENGGSHALYEASGTPSSAEYDVTTSWRIVSNLGAPGFGGRKQSGAITYYIVFWNNTTIELYKVIGASYTLIGSYTFTPTVGNDYTLKLQIRDAAKKVFLDGVERISSTDNAITGAGKVALRPDNATSSTGIHCNDLAADPSTFPQVLNPYQDGPQNGWVNEAGTTPVAPSIGELVESDTTYAKSPASPVAAAIADYKLNAANDPVSSSGHTLSLAFAKDTPGVGDAETLTVRLMQYAPGNGARFEILNQVYTSVEAKQSPVITLTGAQADAIVDYGDLWIRVEAIKV